MAAFACRGPMLAEQGIFRVSVMIKRQGFPALLNVALLTLLAEVRSVDVIFFVAGMASRRGLLLVELALMAAVTFHLAVVPLQWIVGIPIVLEEQRVPVAFGVTADAVLSKAALVFVIFLVARNAIDRSFVFV